MKYRPCIKTVVAIFLLAWCTTLTAQKKFFNLTAD